MQGAAKKASDKVASKDSKTATPAKAKSVKVDKIEVAAADVMTMRC